jgi:hypothetical protein
MKEGKKELEVLDTTSKKPCLPVDLIQQAIEKGSNLEQIEKLMQLQERWEANEAKKAYFEAMAAFKASPPEINKDRTVKYKDVKYNHASLYNVTEKINTELSKHGLSASWKVQQNGIISVTCKIVHIRGYGEETTISAASDTSGSKNAIQAVGSTITYLQRYSLLSLTGLATFDDDGAASGGIAELINADEINQIEDLLVKSQTDIDKFVAWLKVDSLAALPKSEFRKAIVALEAKLKVKR